MPSLNILSIRHSRAFVVVGRRRAGSVDHCPKFRELVDDIYALMTSRPTSQPAREGAFPVPASR